MYKNIILSGASTIFPGFASRIEKEIKKLYVDKNLKLSKNKRIIPINLVDSQRRNYSSFIGATVLSNIYNNSETEKDYWISKQEWDEDGPNIVLKKCRNT